MCPFFRGKITSCDPIYDINGNDIKTIQDTPLKRGQTSAREYDEIMSVCYGREDIILLEVEDSPFSPDQVIPVGSTARTDISYSLPFFSTLRVSHDYWDSSFYRQHQLRLIKTDSAHYAAPVLSLRCVDDDFNRLFVGCLPVRGDSGSPVLAMLDGRYVMVGVFSSYGLNASVLFSDNDFEEAQKKMMHIYNGIEFQMRGTTDLGSKARDYLKRESLFDGTDPKYPFAMHAAWVTQEVIDKISTLQTN